MLIQVAMNNIESIEQGEEILKKWQYHLDEDQSHVVLERDVLGVTVYISGFHPWADEVEEDGEACSCGGDGDSCECHNHQGRGAEEIAADEDDEVDDEEVEDDEDDEESEVIYLGQALFIPAGDQPRALASELMDDDYIGTVSVSMAGALLTDTDAFRALPADTKNAVITAIEELGDTEAYLSMYEVMGLRI